MNDHSSITSSADHSSITRGVTSLAGHAGALKPMQPGALMRDCRLGLDGYQEFALGTAVYPGRGSPLGLIYVALKMSGEAGEVAEKIGLAIRQDDLLPVTGSGDEGTLYFPGSVSDARRDSLVGEIGDVAWYLAAGAAELGYRLSDLMGNDINAVSLMVHQAYPFVDCQSTRGLLTYSTFLVSSATGFSELVGKAIRDDGLTSVMALDDQVVSVMFETLPEARVQALRTKLTQVLAALVLVCRELQVTLEDALTGNLDKLAGRAARGTLQGSGDDR